MNDGPVKSWWDAREKQHAFQEAREMLDTVEGTAEHKAVLLNQIINACYQAAHYDPRTDPNTRRRSTVKESKAAIARLAQSANSLARAFRRDDPAIGWASHLAELESGVRLTRAVHDGPASSHEVAARYFEALVAALNGRLPEIHGGPFQHRTQVGNLLFPDPVAAGRRGDVDVATRAASSWA